MAAPLRLRGQGRRLRVQGGTVSHKSASLDAPAFAPQGSGKPLASCSPWTGQRRRPELERKQALTEATGHGLGTCVGAELREHRRDVVFHRMGGDAELGGNLPVDETLRHQPEHIAFPHRECRTFFVHRTRHRTGVRIHIIQHHVGLRWLAHEYHLGIATKQFQESPSPNGIPHTEKDAQLHGRRARTTCSTEGTGTASATPFTIIVLSPITNPSASAIGPPLLPGASRMSACTQGRRRCAVGIG